jgi:hypothetical protein
MKVGVVEAFAHTAMVVNGTSRHFAAPQNLSAIGIRADIDQPLFELFFRSFDLVVDDLARFREGIGRH